MEYKGVFEPKPHHVLRSGRIAVQRARMLESWIQPGKALLDVGCGGGELVFVLGKQGVEACGHEEDVRYAHYARRELGIRVTDGPWEAIGHLSPAAFDMVTLFHVLEHLPHPVEALTQFRDWLRPGGCVVVEVPNLEFSRGRSLHRFHRAHLYHFNAATLAAAGEAAGLRATDVFTSGDGGNLIARFERGSGIAAAFAGIPGNCELILSRESARSEARYWLAPSTWGRTLRRLSRMTQERVWAGVYRDRRSLLESVLPRANPNGLSN